MLVNTQFYLFNRNDSTDGYLMKAWNVENLRASPFKPEIPTKLTIPGWLDNKVLAKWVRDIRDALLVHDNYNVIIVEWVNFTPYFIATANSRIVGAEITRFLRFLMVKLIIYRKLN